MWNPKRILAPVDFSACSRAAVEWASRFAVAVAATVDVLHVWETPVHVGPEMLVHIPGERTQTLGQFTGLRARGEMERFLAMTEQPQVVRGRIESGDPVEVIVRLAGDYDLVVVGTHGRTGVQRLILGSVAERVVRLAPCAVAVVPAPE